MTTSRPFRLAADVLARVADALALVRLGLAQLADVGRDLADLLLVDPLDGELGGRLDGERDAVGRLDQHRVAEAERELQVRALGLHAVADADDLELLLVALGHPGDHVGDQRAREAVQRLALALVVGTGHGERAVLGLLHD
jgi:hypothetical protein